MRHTFVFSVLCAASLCACTFKTPATPSTGSGATAEQAILSTTPFVSQHPKLTITPPRAWKVDNSGNMGTIVVFQNAVSDVESGSAFAANIYVIQEDTAGMTFEDYIKANRVSLKTFDEDYASTDDHTLSVNGNQAQILEGTYKQDEFQVRGRQLIIMKGNVAYIVVATTLASKWDKYKAAFDATLGSVEL